MPGKKKRTVTGAKSFITIQSTNINNHAAIDLSPYVSFQSSKPVGYNKKRLPRYNTRGETRYQSSRVDQEKTNKMDEVDIRTRLGPYALNRLLFPAVGKRARLMHSGSLAISRLSW